MNESLTELRDEHIKQLMFKKDIKWYEELRTLLDFCEEHKVPRKHAQKFIENNIKLCG